jgi:hypothetical protein
MIKWIFVCLVLLVVVFLVTDFYERLTGPVKVCDCQKSKGLH